MKRLLAGLLFARRISFRDREITVASVPIIAIQAPILHGFGDMLGADAG